MIKKLLLLLFCLGLSSHGSAIAQDSSRSSKFLYDSPYQVKVKKIFDRFIISLGKNPERYTILVEKSDELNAYATVGKKIVVSSALIDSINSEAGLAFVIAHELGHIELNHVFNSLIRDHLFLATKYFFFRESAVFDGVNYFHSLHYSRGSEKNADLFAESLTNKFYCNMPGKLEFFEEAAKKRSSSKITEYLNTHPLPASRLEYLRREIQEAGCKV